MADSYSKIKSWPRPAQYPVPCGAGIDGAGFFIATQLPLQDTFFIVLGFAGGAVLLYFAWQVSKLRSVSIENGGGVVFTPIKIFLLSATNSPLYIFWTTICFPPIWQLAVVIYPTIFSNPRSWGI